MSAEVPTFLIAAAIGVGATLFIDLWALFLKRAFNVPSANYCLVGRWFCHMPEGKFMHESIANAPPKRLECAVGWIAHYVIGVVYALLFIALVSDRWLEMQPAFGLGIAATRTPNPAQARMRRFMAHAVFGVGLYIVAVCGGVTL